MMPKPGRDKVGKTIDQYTLWLIMQTLQQYIEKIIHCDKVGFMPEIQC